MNQKKLFTGVLALSTLLSFQPLVVLGEEAVADGVEDMLTLLDDQERLILEQARQDAHRFERHEDDKLTAANVFNGGAFLTFAGTGLTLNKKKAIGITGLVSVLIGGLATDGATTLTDKNITGEAVLRELIRELKLISLSTLRDPELNRETPYSELVGAFRFDQSMSYSDKAKLVASLVLKTQKNAEQFQNESYPATEMIRDVLGDHYNDRNAQILNNLAELNQSV